MILTKEPGIGIGRDVDVARALYDGGNYKEAYALAMRVYESAVDTDERVRAILTASSCRAEQRRYSEALETLTLACPLLDEARPLQQANFFGQRAHVHTKLKDDENVVIDYEASLFYAREAGDRVTEARARNNLAGCYAKVGRFEESISESDLAIAIARSSGDRVLLGSFYDQKAQTLISMEQYSDAVVLSKKAVDILGEHPSGTEARTTHGRALVALGGSYLETGDPVDTFCAKRKAAKLIDKAPSPALMQLALDRVGGRVAPAAELLGISYPTLIKSIERHRLARQKPQRRGKSLHLK